MLLRQSYLGKDSSVNSAYLAYASVRLFVIVLTIGFGSGARI
jgi:hypothetical protein